MQPDSFRPAFLALRLEINQTAKIDVTLKIGASTTVVVQEQIHPILDTTDSTVGNTISSN